MVAHSSKCLVSSRESLIGCLGLAEKLERARHGLASPHCPALAPTLPCLTLAPTYPPKWFLWIESLVVQRLHGPTAQSGIPQGTWSSMVDGPNTAKGSTSDNVRQGLRVHINCAAIDLWV